MRGRPSGLRKAPIAPMPAEVSATLGSTPPMPIGPAPLTPPAGATDGLGMGQGGLAIHPSLKPHNIAGREPRHTSRTR
jgi:hypothetical protein